LQLQTVDTVTCTAQTGTPGGAKRHGGRQTVSWSETDGDLCRTEPLPALGQRRRP